jgi:hypothetical protein
VVPDLLKDHDASIFSQAVLAVCLPACLPAPDDEHIIILLNAAHYSPNNTANTSRNTETLSKLMAEHQTRYIYYESKYCGFRPVLLYIFHFTIYYHIKIIFTSAIVVLFK